MYLALRTLARMLTCTGMVAATAITAGAQSPDLNPESATPPGLQVVRLLSGGGRIWEGPDVSRPTADITFSGHIERIGPGNTTADFQCRWTVRFQDVQGTQFDGAVFTARACRDLSVWASGGDPDVGMRVVLDGDLNGQPGYSLTILAVDWTQPGAQDQIRFRLWRGAFDPANPNPDDLLYDTNWEFAIYPGTSARTLLDAGNLQSKVE
jgi:hypothetical protein